LGYAYQRLEGYEESIKAYQAAIQIDPNHADAYNNLGATYYLQGRLTEAVEALVQAIRLESNLADAYFNLGAVHVARRERGEALKQYAPLRTLNPKLASILCKGISKGKVIDVADRSAFGRK